ncbi:MAG: FtsH protease activity modulator HflK [Lachnospiraceae bacterium]|nr:FtsH protease activity modulator HflK [Lachnospiraceae bacterium]
MPNFGKYYRYVLIIAAAVIIIFGGFYNVSEQENAVVTMFGRVIRTDTAGLYFKIPFLQKVHYVDITTHGTGVGYSLDNNGQNITDETNGIMITSDFNLLDIDFYLEYRVSDPVAYLYASDNPEEILKNIALSSIRSVVADFTVDEAMTTAKGQIQANVKEDMTRELNEHDIGLAVVNITVQDSEPPTDEIKQAFKAVETAKQGADTAKNNALAYQNEQIPKADANADKIIQSAEADKAARIAEAEGQVVRFNEMYDQYRLYPGITKKRMFYETMEELLPSLKVIISDGSTQTLMPLDSFSADTQETAGSNSASADTTANTAGTAADERGEE